MTIPIEREALHKMISAMRRHRQMFDAMREKTGLGRSAHRALMILADHGDLSQTALAERGIALHVTDGALTLIAKESYSRKYGARNMRRYIQKNVEDALAERMIADYNRTITQARVFVRGGAIAIETM